MSRALEELVDLGGGDVAMWATTRLIDLVGPAAQATPLEKWFRDGGVGADRIRNTARR